MKMTKKVLDELKKSGTIKDYTYSRCDGQNENACFEELIITFNDKKTLYISPISGGLWWD